MLVTMVPRYEAQPVTLPRRSRASPSSLEFSTHRAKSSAGRANGVARHESCALLSPTPVLTLHPISGTAVATPPVGRKQTHCGKCLAAQNNSWDRRRSFFSSLPDIINNIWGMIPAQVIGLARLMCCRPVARPRLALTKDTSARSRRVQLKQPRKFTSTSEYAAVNSCLLKLKGDACGTVVKSVTNSCIHRRQTPSHPRDRCRPKCQARLRPHLAGVGPCAKPGNALTISLLQVFSPQR
jgi:hypothetical protein